MDATISIFKKMSLSVLFVCSVSFICAIQSMVDNSNYIERGRECDMPAMQMVWIEGDGCIDGYWIAATEVTQAQWEAVMGTTIHDMDAISNWRGIYGEGDDYPMYHVNYYDALVFCRELSASTGRNYTLPTEAQWKHAARGGQNFEYSGSNNIDDVAWYENNSGNTTHPVAQKQANGYGLYDMSGNVWEWCLDMDDNRQSYRVCSGGCWVIEALECYVAFRNSGNPSYRDCGTGFRVVCLP